MAEHVPIVIGPARASGDKPSFVLPPDRVAQVRGRLLALTAFVAVVCAVPPAGQRAEATPGGRGASSRPVTWGAWGAKLTVLVVKLKRPYDPAARGDGSRAMSDFTAAPPASPFLD